MDHRTYSDVDSQSPDTSLAIAVPTMYSYVEIVLSLEPKGPYKF